MMPRAKRRAEAATAAIYGEDLTLVMANKRAGTRSHGASGDVRFGPEQGRGGDAEAEATTTTALAMTAASAADDDMGDTGAAAMTTVAGASLGASSARDLTGTSQPETQ